MNQENIISKRILPQYEINDAHSRWNYHRILETGNEKMAKITDYGHPERAFFQKFRNFWAWADKLG